MDTRIKALLEAYKNGKLSMEECERELRTLPYEELGDVCLDHHRRFRDILPEVVYGPGKTAEQIASIVQSLHDAGGPLLITRVDKETAEEVMRRMKANGINLAYASRARAIYCHGSQGRGQDNGRGYVLVVTAGTGDIPVAEEACLTLELSGHETRRLYDAGVAGVHRLLSRIGLLQEATVIIAVAGMDGALPSVIGGLVATPVIAVPTSTGYGANFGGVAPLLTMLNSCATGVAAVNIDNGFGAATVAAMINRRRSGD